VSGRTGSLSQEIRKLEEKKNLENERIQKIGRLNSLEKERKRKEGLLSQELEKINGRNKDV